MPYRWTETDPEHKTLLLWPHSSLPKEGFAIVIMMTFVLIITPLFMVLGTVVFWGLLPFLIGTVFFLWWGLQRSYRDQKIRETLTITDDNVHLLREQLKRDTKEWTCNSYWTRVSLHETGGPVPNYVTLAGNGREVEIGAFLSEEERIGLFDELKRNIHKA